MELRRDEIVGHDHRSGGIAGVEGDGHVVVVGQCARLEDKGTDGVGIEALLDVGRGPRGVVIHIESNLLVSHQIGHNRGFGIGLPLSPQIGLDFVQVSPHLRGVLIERGLVELAQEGIGAAGHPVENVTDENAADVVGQGRIGELAGIGLDPGLQLLEGVGRRVADLSGVILDNELGVAPGRLVAIDRIAKIEGQGRIIPIDVD